jgi:hypothetical protein
MQHPSTKRSTQAPRARRATVQTSEILDSPDPALEGADEIQARPQRRLPFGPARRIQQAQQLIQRLRRRLGQSTVELTLTDNRAVMISVRRDAPRRHYEVRAHQLFCEAPEEIIDALARYIVLDDRKASRALGHYIDLNDHRIGPPRGGRPADKPRETRLRTGGKHHDLQATFNVLNERYFAGKVAARITWGRNVARGKARSSVRLGSYTVEEQLIRIHPGLDQRWIPPIYLQWVVFHEMLHAVMPILTVNGRRRFHSRDFTNAEARFEGIAEARTWEQRHLPQLLRI